MAEETCTVRRMIPLSFLSDINEEIYKKTGMA